MVSVYYPVDGTVGMTHYCMLGNRPEFRAEQTKADEINFKFIATPGIDPTRDHLMAGVQMKFLGDNAIFMKWSGLKDGKPDHDKEVIFRRVG
jgi:hypothetical protein